MGLRVFVKTVKPPKNSSIMNIFFGDEKTGEGGIFFGFAVFRISNQKKFSYGKTEIKRERIFCTRPNSQRLSERTDLRKRDSAFLRPINLCSISVFQNL